MQGEDSAWGLSKAPAALGPSPSRGGVPKGRQVLHGRGRLVDWVATRNTSPSHMP